jgi:hypothetical protein
MFRALCILGPPDPKSFGSSRLPIQPVPIVIGRS